MSKPVVVMKKKKRRVSSNSDISNISKTIYKVNTFENKATWTRSLHNEDLREA